MPRPNPIDPIIWLGALSMPFYMLSLQERRRAKMTPQEIYERAYKEATGEGEGHKGAHHRGLEAVYKEALWRVSYWGWAKSFAHKLVVRLERKLRP